MRSGRTTYGGDNMGGSIENDDHTVYVYVAGQKRGGRRMTQLANNESKA
jgi:hypothetical protein